MDAQKAASQQPGDRGDRMILSRWCCDTCFVQLWLGQGISLESCLRCGSPWRHVRDDHFDSICACGTVPAQQMNLSPVSSDPVLDREVKAGAGAKRPKDRSANHAESRGKSRGAASKAKGPRLEARSPTGDEGLVQLRLWNLESGTRKAVQKVTAIDAKRRRRKSETRTA